MSQYDKLREQIDACRLGSDDLALRELAELAQAVERDPAVADELARSQHFDRAVAAALHDVPVPAGLLDWLLATTQASSITPAGAVEPAARQQSRPRRRWLIAGGSLAVAALIGLTIFAFRPRQLPIVAQTELNQLVDGWFQQAIGDQKGWSAANALPATFAAPADLMVPTTRWRQFRASGSGWSGRGVAIDLALPTKQRAVLFVISPNVRFPVAETPYTPLMLSGGLQAVAWQNKNSNVLYVLVVKDPGQPIDQLFPAAAARVSQHSGCFVSWALEDPS